jgi:probable F420-dependent oxidoreductase
MKIGVVFPSTDMSVIRDFAQTAEGLGYSHLLLPDHVLGAVHENRQPPLEGPYTENTPFHEPLVLFAYLAAITTKIEFASGIMILPQRQTALLAKQAAELAILSGNRYRMAVGTGWNYVEYQALNETWFNRAKRQEEQIEVLRKLWTEHVVNYSGNWHRIDRAGILPRPTEPVPIWIGGYKDVVHRRAARLADGFVFPGVNMREASELMAKMRGYVAEYGRDPDKFGFEGAVAVHASRDKWIPQLENWRKLGASHVVVRAMSREGKSLEKPQDHIRMLEEYWRHVHG